MTRRQPSPERLSARRRFWAHAASVRRMYEDGLSTSAIAQRAGSTREVVRRYLRASYFEPGDGEAWDSQRHEEYMAVRQAQRDKRERERARRKA